MLDAGFYRLAQALLETGEAAQAASAIDSGLGIDPGQFCCRGVLGIDLTPFEFDWFVPRTALLWFALQGLNLNAS